MMRELCLGALKLQGRQSFWAADGMCSRGAEDGLLRKTREKRKKREKGKREISAERGEDFSGGQRTSVWGYSDEREGGVTAEYSGKGLC